MQSPRLHGSRAKVICSVPGMINRCVLVIPEHGQTHVDRPSSSSLLPVVAQCRTTIGAAFAAVLAAVLARPDIPHRRTRTILTIAKRCTPMLAACDVRGDFSGPVTRFKGAAEVTGCIAEASRLFANARVRQRGMLS